MKKYSDVITPLLKEIRTMVLPHFGNVEKVEHKDDSGLNVVTELDRKVETFLAERLQQAYPDIAFVGEEFGGEKNAERFWLVDPIDGTANFIRGNAYCTTMIALIEEGRVMFSVIYDFVRDETYIAERGKGATKNGQRLQVSTRPLKEAFLGYEIKLTTPEKVKMFVQLDTLFGLVKTLSAGHEYTLIATGKIEGRICFDPYGFDYDYAPGSLLVEEAGGIVRNIGSDSYTYTNSDFVAANPVVYKELKELGLV